MVALFPHNGVDRSLHVAVLVGLCFATFFTEALGWTYAGLVVPGYLATIFAAAPVTGACVVVESIATYLLVAAVGRWVPLTGAWSTAFGRERFYLFIVVAVLVRLGMEGTVLPALAARFQFQHAADLYSIGLVLVPLVANAFWNAGLVRALPRIALTVGLTFATLWLLLRFTNLSTSRFLVINDQLSMRFFEQPKAQIILVIGALLGAWNNVRYGWDYNGILVPGLLAVAWYEPTKLLSTVVEALIIYALCTTIVSVRPFSRLLIVGTRRMLLAYTIGMIVKMAFGHWLARYRPGTQIIDYFGFGYLLPSLIAVKIWNKDNVGVVIMPTIQVSLVAFLTGNGAGFALNAISERAAAAREAAPEPLDVTGSVPFELLLADTAPALRDRTLFPGEAQRAALAIAADVDEAGEPRAEALARAKRAGLRFGRGEGEVPWIYVVPRVDDPDVVSTAPRAAVRRLRGRARRLVVLDGARPGSPLPVVADHVADAVDAAAIVLLSRLPEQRRLDERFARQLAGELDLTDVLVIEEGPAEGPKAALRLAGPPRDLHVVDIGRRLAEEVEIRWTAPGPATVPFGGAPHLVVAAPLAERVAASILGAPEIEAWTGALQSEIAMRNVALTTAGRRGFVAPTIEELRLFDTIVDAPLRRWWQDGAAGDPSPWARAAAARLGFRFLRVGPAEGPATALGVAETTSDRRGNPTWIGRPGARRADDVLFEIAAPRWELGVLGAGLAFHRALDGASILISGTLPNADPRGGADPRRVLAARTFYQRIHERWLGAGGAAVSVQGIAPDRGYAGDGVISFGFELLEEKQTPAWVLPLTGLLARDLGLSVLAYDGSSDRAPFSGTYDPTMAYARKFEEGRFAILFLSGSVRRGFELSNRDDEVAKWVARIGVAVATRDVAARAVELCAAPGGRHRGCRRQEVIDALARYADVRNPYDMRAAIDAKTGCAVEVARDADSGRIWAIVPSAGEVDLVGITAARTDRPPVSVAEEGAVRRAVAAGLARIRVPGRSP